MIWRPVFIFSGAKAVVGDGLEGSWW